VYYKNELILYDLNGGGNIVKVDGVEKELIIPSQARILEQTAAGNIVGGRWLVGGCLVD
jgi:hypothetical protein